MCNFNSAFQTQRIQLFLTVGIITVDCGIS